MGISEEKMKIVINNYFKSECDVNTSIREAFEKGFRIGVKKGLAQSKADTPQTEKPKWTKENCKGCKYNDYPYDDSTCFIKVCIDGNKYEPQTDCGWK